MWLPRLYIETREDLGRSALIRPRHAPLSTLKGIADTPCVIMSASMRAPCPACGSTDVRLSKTRGITESLKRVFGVYPLRCKRCSHRFTDGLWSLRNLRYAKCPKCYRMELSTWSERYYVPRPRTTILLRLGATPYRCESCRCNFVSFRACKERFSWRKKQSTAAAERPHL